MQLGVRKLAIHFFFQLIKKGLQVFDLPILINKNPNAPDLWKKKLNNQEFALITMGPTLIVRVSLQLGKSPSAPPWVLHAHKS